ncbi:MAG: YraN family protein [Patescibacteria group bacterium]
MKKIGQIGEELAADYLKKQGYRILERNFRTRFGEIDLVAFKSGTLVFVEVKTRTTSDPEWGITPAKIAKVRRMAEVFLVQKQPQYQDLRLDAVCVTLGEEEKITHYPSVAFGA